MKIAFIFPHPDDETIFAGGTILRHVAAGDEVVWLCASYGERGGATERRSPKMFYRMFALAGRYPFLLFFQTITVHWLAVFRRRNGELAKIRKQEAEKVASILGVRKVYFMEIPDMRFGWDRSSLMHKLRTLIEEMRPDIVYTLHPNGITGHPDHVALSKCVAKAISNLEEKKPRLLYATFPEGISKKHGLPLIGIPEDSISEKIVLLPEELEKKKKAIGAYASQQYLWKIFLEKYPEVLEKEYFVEV